MKAIILAAGKGSRLGKISQGQPKCMICIEESTLLEVQINVLHSCGIENISVVRGYKGYKINIPGLKYYDNPDYASTNMLHSLFCARKEIKDDILILYSDIIYEKQVIERILNSHHDCVAGVLVNWKEAIHQRNKISLEELEMVYFDSENRIQEIGKKLTDEYETKGQFIGIVKCSQWGTKILEKNYDRVKSLYSGKTFGQAKIFEKAWLTDLLQEMIELGVPLYCAIIERGWMEIDTPEDYERSLKDTKFVRRLVKVKTDWDKRSELYNHLKWTSKDELLENIVDMAGDLNNKKILDLGTGTGKILIALYKYFPAAEYYGVDISQGMLNKIDPSYKFNLSISEIENLKQFKANYFDLITARMVFHHSRDFKKAMKEVYRVLKPGGRFIICEGNPPNRATIPFYEEMFHFKEDRITFLLDDLINLLLSVDFKQIISRTVILKEMSLTNWLNNSGLPFRNIDIITKMHYNCDDSVKDAYNMKINKNDILMDWKFSIVAGVKKKKLIISE
jgi:choline kinase